MKGELIEIVNNIPITKCTDLEGQSGTRYVAWNPVNIDNLYVHSSNLGAVQLQCQRLKQYAHFEDFVFDSLIPLTKYVMLLFKKDVYVEKLTDLQVIFVYYKTVRHRNGWTTSHKVVYHIVKVPHMTNAISIYKEHTSILDRGSNLPLNKDIKQSKVEEVPCSVGTILANCKHLIK